MNWFVLTIISAVTYAASEIIGKYVSDKKSEPVFIGIIAAMFTTVFMYLTLLLESFVMPSNTWAFMGLIISSLLVAIGFITYYQGLKHTDVSEFGLISRSRTLFIVIGGIILFREQFNYLHIIGAGLVVYGVFLLSWEKRSFTFGSGSRFALITAVLLGSAALIDKAVISYFTVSMYTFLSYFFTVVFMLPIALYRFFEGITLPRKSTFVTLFFIGILDGISAYCIYWAYLANGPVSLVSLVGEFDLLITVCWGIIIMKERKKLASKLFSMGLLIAGLLLIK